MTAVNEVWFFCSAASIAAAPLRAASFGRKRVKPSTPFAWERVSARVMLLVVELEVVGVGVVEVE